MPFKIEISFDISMSSELSVHFQTAVKQQKTFTKNFPMRIFGEDEGVLGMMGTVLLYTKRAPD